MAWHIERQNPLSCHRGLLELYSKCTAIKEGERDMPCTSSRFRNNCHNLIEICLGPVKSHSDFALYHVDKLANINRQLQEIFDPIPLLKFVKESIEVITVERIQNVIEECKLMGDGLISSVDFQDQFDVRSDVLFSKVFQPIKDVSLVEEELHHVLENLTINLIKARENLKKIEEVTKLVDVQICELPKKWIRNQSEVKKPRGELFGAQNLETDDCMDQHQDDIKYDVEAICDTSSAYHAVEYEDRSSLNYLIHGSGYALNLKKGPLLVAKFKSSEPIPEKYPREQSMNLKTFAAGAVETESTMNFSTKRRWLRRLLLPLMGLLATM
ncbi:hypothetical protein Aperf_G00000008679 [Anoplocephala perfoliata]